MAKRRSKKVPVTRKVAKSVKVGRKYVRKYITVTTYKTVYYWA